MHKASLSMKRCERSSDREKEIHVSDCVLFVSSREVIDNAKLGRSVKKKQMETVISRFVSRMGI